jgi:hypothetical protein
MGHVPDCYGSLVPFIGFRVAYPKTAVKQARCGTYRVRVREKASVEGSKFVQRDLGREAGQPHTTYINRHV